MRLEPLSEAHADSLSRAFADDALWRYMGVGPFDDRASFSAWLDGAAAGQDPMFFAIAPRMEIDGEPAPAAGVLSYLRINAAHGVIEIGHLVFAPRLQRSAAATEAVSTLIDHAFDLGYRRVEWKCNALNTASRRAAARYGFQFEGVFRQAMVVKGRNRDTAWFSIIEGEWPAIKAAHQHWLEPANFDEDGRQRVALSTLTESLQVEGGPLKAGP